MRGRSIRTCAYSGEGGQIFVILVRTYHLNDPIGYFGCEPLNTPLFKSPESVLQFYELYHIQQLNLGRSYLALIRSFFVVTVPFDSTNPSLVSCQSHRLILFPPLECYHKWLSHSLHLFVSH